MRPSGLTSGRLRKILVAPAPVRPSPTRRGGASGHAVPTECPIGLLDTERAGR